MFAPGINPYKVMKLYLNNKIICPKISYLLYLWCSKF